MSCYFTFIFFSHLHTVITYNFSSDITSSSFCIFFFLRIHNIFSKQIPRRQMSFFSYFCRQAGIGLSFWNALVNIILLKLKNLKHILFIFRKSLFYFMFFAYMQFSLCMRATIFSNEFHITYNNVCFQQAGWQATYTLYYYYYFKFCVLLFRRTVGANDVRLVVCVCVWTGALWVF